LFDPSWELFRPLFKFILELVGLEFGTFGGRFNLLVVALVFVMLVVPPVFEFIGNLITALFVRFLTPSSPKPYLARPRSRITDIALFMGSFVLSMLTVWWTGL
jgi:hypothetical protein